MKWIMLTLLLVGCSSTSVEPATQDDTWNDLPDNCHIASFNCDSWKVTDDGKMELSITPQGDYSDISVEACGQTKSFEDVIYFDGCDVSVDNTKKTHIEITVMYSEGELQMSSPGMLRASVLD